MADLLVLLQDIILVEPLLCIGSVFMPILDVRILNNNMTIERQPDNCVFKFHVCFVVMHLATSTCL